MDKKVFFGRNLAYLADFWLWAFYMRNPALCLSFSLFLSFSMSISLFSLFLHVYISLHIYLSSPLKKNTSNVLTNAGIVFGGSASSPARVASWYYQHPGSSCFGPVGSSSRRIGPKTSTQASPHGNFVLRASALQFGLGGWLFPSWPFRSHPPPPPVAPMTSTTAPARL